jgi:hypothetical protein
MAVQALSTNNQPFPSNKNVRIAIAGLSVNDLDRDISIIRFLRHVPYHSLSLKITTRKSDGSVSNESKFILNDNHNVVIEGSDSVMPQSYIHLPTGIDEYSLNEMVNLWDLHGHELNIKVAMPNPPPSLLNLKHGSFYTRKLTEYKFDLEKNGQKMKTDSRFGEVLGAYMQCISGTLNVTIQNHQNSPEPFPIFDENGNPFFYDIEFVNHCTDPDACSNLIGDGQTDFAFLYDIVEDNGSPIDAFSIVKPTSGLPVSWMSFLNSPVGTGACLSAIRKPCTNC